jgi:hypothetical protein
MKKILLSITALAVAGASIAQTNLDIEAWSMGNPTGWVTSNLFYAPTTVAQVTGNASTSAMQITTDSVTDLQSGTPDTTGFAIQLIASAPTYTSIQFDYKTSYIGTSDTGYVSFVFLDNGSSYGATIMLIPTPAWYSTPAVNISSLYAGAAGQGIATDSVLISVYSSSASTPVRGNAITIDNIILNSPTAGIYEVFSGVNVKTFPNPTSDVINFEIDTDENLTISIFALDGSLVKTISKTSTLTTISLDGMDKGSYIYRVAKLNGNTVKTGKFIKQ